MKESYSKIIKLCIKIISQPQCEVHNFHLRHWIKILPFFFVLSLYYFLLALVSYCFIFLVQSFYSAFRATFCHLKRRTFFFFYFSFFFTANLFALPMSMGSIFLFSGKKSIAGLKNGPFNTKMLREILGFRCAPICLGDFCQSLYYCQKDQNIHSETRHGKNSHNEFWKITTIIDIIKTGLIQFMI